MIFSIIVASVFVIGGLVCYASCWAAGRADERSERYYYRKMLEKEVEKQKEDSNKLTYNDIRALYDLDPIDENLKNE